RLPLPALGGARAAPRLLLRHLYLALAGHHRAARSAAAGGTPGADPGDPGRGAAAGHAQLAPGRGAGAAGGAPLAGAPRAAGGGRRRLIPPHELTRLYPFLLDRRPDTRLRSRI